MSRKMVWEVVPVKKWMRQRLLLIGLLMSSIVLLWTVGTHISHIPAMGDAQQQMHVLVLDAGHGGIDGGAVAEDGTVEQDINLHIVTTSRDLAGFLGIPVVLTRADQQSLDYNPEKTIRQNKVADIHAREQLVKQQNNPVFVSVHLNKFSDASYSGAQTFWSKNNAEGQRLAESIQQALTDGLHPERVRTAKAAENSIYLMKQLTCPAVIVECGFLSNAEDVAKLKESAYHTKLAVCIIGGYQNQYGA